MKYILDSVWGADGLQTYGSFMNIANLTYPTSVEPNTAFDITYDAVNAASVPLNAYGMIWDTVANQMVAGSDWTAQIPVGGTKHLVLSFPTGISQQFSGEVRVGHIEADIYTFMAIAGTGGTISGTANGNYPQGTAINVTAYPNSGYVFLNWTISGLSGLPNTNPTLSFNMPANAVTVQANFQQTQTYIFTAAENPTAGGIISGSLDGAYVQGAAISVTATPNSGYMFLNWSGSGISLPSTNPTLSFNMPGNAVNVQANFQLQTPCSQYTNPATCVNNGCHWWISDGKCHDTPEPPACSTYINPNQCILNGCNWWPNNTCHPASEPMPCSTYNSNPDACVAAGCIYNWDTNECRSKGEIQIDPMIILIGIAAVAVVGVAYVVVTKKK